MTETLIICMTFLAAVKIITDSVNKFRVSKSHLHSFNRRAESLLSDQKIKLETVNQLQESRLVALEAEVKSIRNALAFKVRQ